MKSPIAVMALFGSLVASTAWVPAHAQLFGTRGGGSDAAPRSDKQVYKANGALPEPTPVSELKPPTTALPNEPIEPYLLQKQNGPFMVLAKTFRGVDAERMAIALCKELRHDHHLPAYILRPKDMPGKSLIRGTPPTAAHEVMAPEIKLPEKVRTYDEAAVLVGDEKTLYDSEQLLKVVRKIKPKCLDGISSMFPWRTGLVYAYRTTNPFAPAQTLYPRARDKLVMQINGGHHSITNCPGRYSLQVANFMGRSTYELGNQNGQFPIFSSLRESPLQTAAADAERMADKLSKDAAVQALGQPIYVYHDRTSSQVFVGSFDSPQDPRAIETRDQLLKLAVPLMEKNRKGGSLDSMIVPAGALTDLAPIKSKFEQ